MSYSTSFMTPVAALLFSAAFGGSASAFGPDWDEIIDAGKKPGKAQKLFGSGPIQSISGQLGFVLAGDKEDVQDLYLLRIVQPAKIEFSASTDPNLGGDAEFDTRLWLFDSSGFGLLANDDASRNITASTLTDTATDGSGIVITAPGLYYLAVTSDSEAFGDNKGSLTPIFDFKSSTEISGPDGPGGTLPLFDWSSNGSQGTYTIALTGVGFIAAGDTNGDDSVDVDDLLSIINNWGACTDCELDPCLPDLNSDCTVDVDDLLTVINNWN